MPHSTSHHSDDEDYAARAAAAILIQRLWRKKTHKALDDYPLNTNMRWEDATTHAQFAVDRAAAYDSKNSPRERWRRAVFLVGRLQDGNRILRASGMHADAEQKYLETQHWLELVDGKHRYGSNLKWYHRRWQEEHTTDNFFKWLDEGEGKELSLDECPRPQLEKEANNKASKTRPPLSAPPSQSHLADARYLSAEQRLNYLVKIDTGGKLLWAKNNQPVDTTAGRWMDAGDGTGIVPQDLPEGTPKKFRRTASISSTSSKQDNAATHYAGQTLGKYRWTRYLRRHITPRGVMQRLLRRTVRRNTWIYVSDKNFNIFVGIKETGNFQHSSFVAGGLVTSAGLISVKDGMIHTLSPLSGHYRTSINHFHRFIEVLTERGVNMRKVKISKAEAALWGIEHIARWKKAQGKVMGKNPMKRKG